MNPIINLMNRQNPMIAMLQPMYNAMRTAQNPLAVLGQMAMSDERIQQALNSIQQNGGVQQAVYAEAQRRNIDPNNALNQARQMMQSFNLK